MMFDARMMCVSCRCIPHFPALSESVSVVRLESRTRFHRERTRIGSSFCFELLLPATLQEAGWCCPSGI